MSLDEFPLQENCEDYLKFKLASISDSFHRKYGFEPDFFVRAPGRVNLIGEHVDYNGYSVCPMAIEQCVVAAVKKTKDSVLKISNVQSCKYEDFVGDMTQFEIHNDVNGAPKWYSYVICGLKGILDETTKFTSEGIIFHLDGSIPISSGLSSSSALVCASALAMGAILNTNLSKTEIASLTAKAERYIGTEGGGMDQAIIFNGKYGSASYISFGPLRFESVNIPHDGAFVIVQSMATKNKAASNDFNSRVVECRLSSLIIAKTKNLQSWETITKLADAQKALGINLVEMIKIVNEKFHGGYYEKEEVCRILNINHEELENKFLSSNTRNLEKFNLKSRALHVYNEALRTENFKKICKSTKSLTDLGNLMYESHYSLRDLYECSHPDLDELVNLSKECGAFGARLTGAGWGGCMVALVLLDEAENFVQKIQSSYFKKRINFVDVDINHLIFITKPCCGAGIYDIKSLKN